MKTLSVYIIYFFFSFSAGYAQHTLKGKILNAYTDKPIAGVSVYFNNTSIGTLSNEEGLFTIANAIEGELIISSVGFERIVYKTHKESLGKKTFTFKLQPKETVLQDVMIMPDATRQKYLNLFKENFLGITEEADMSRITNLAAVYFVKPSNDKHGIIALSDTPLTIINRKLGYRVSFDLVQFYLNEKDGRTSFYGYTRYNEMADKKKYIKNRKRVYYGSSLHFYRALIGNVLQPEGYDIYRIREDTMKQQPGAVQVEVKKMDIAFTTKATDIISFDTATGLFFAKWGPKLMVQYNRKPAGKDYLAHKRFLTGSLPNGFRSYLHLQADSLGIDNYGILLNPMDVFYSGYWIYEKAANLLPFNYYPDKED
ncbi:MAG: carboxypeptidase-like regulatory domain-containing protein [Sphingobacteriales bacterium]|nr:MAG: carboxypeptidase-like regulatory domain-containing protein [Sphingobacteriales bacterium]